MENDCPMITLDTANDMDNEDISIKDSLLSG